MNLVKAQELAKDLSIQELQKYANGSNPAVMPPYIALGALQAKELIAKKMQAMQGASQGDQPSIKEQIEQKSGLMALQQQQQNQAQQQMMLQAQRQPMPAPAGIPEPVAQPEPEPLPMGTPFGMAQGGITRLPVQFNFDEGGIIGYAGPDGSEVVDPVAEAQARAQQALDKLRTYGLRQRQQDPEGYAAAEQESQRTQNEVASLERAIAGGPAGAMGRSMGEAQLPAPISSVPPMAERLNEGDMALRSAPAGLPAALLKPPVAQGNVPPRPPALAQAPRPTLPAAPSAPAQGALNITPNQDQLIAEEAARRKAFGITGEAGAAAESRMAGRRKQFEDAKPSGLDDLIRVFGQAGQYKGLSGLGPAYTSNEDRKRAQQAAFETQMENQQTEIDSARRTENAARAVTISTELGKSRELSQKAEQASANIITQLEVARIQAASANRPGETERMMAEYGRLKQTNSAAAEQYMQNIMRIKSGVAGDRQDLAGLKILQAFYEKQLDLMKGNGVSKQEKLDASKKLVEINNKIAAMSGIGGATKPTADRLKFDAAGKEIK